MPKPGQTQAIADEDRARYEERLAELARKEPDAVPPWTRAGLAERLHVHKSTITNIFNGVQKQSTLKGRLEKMLGIAVPPGQIAREILLVLAKLDMGRRERLLERARALLDEQLLSSKS